MSIFSDMVLKKNILLLVTFLLSSVSIHGFEIPVPDIEEPIEIFSATFDGEAVIGWPETEYWDYDPMYITRLDYFYLWKTCFTGFEPEPECEIRYSYYPRSEWPSYWNKYYVFFFMDGLDRIHYKNYSYYDYFTNTYQEGSESWNYSPPNYSGNNSFCLNSSSHESWGYNWTHSTSEYYFTKDGKFIALEYHREEINYGYSDDLVYTKVVPYTGNKINYYGDIGSVLPRLNPTTDLPYFLQKQQDGHALSQVFFEDTITSSVIYQTDNDIIILDFQPDIAGNLHIIWTEQENGLYYAYYDTVGLSAPVFLGSPETYSLQAPQILLNEAGDLLIFSKSSANQACIWYKYYYDSDWSHFNPDTGTGYLDKLQAQLDETGGFSIMQCGAYYSAFIFFWRSLSRGSQINSNYYGYPHWNQVRSACIAPDGNLAALVLLSNGTYVVFRNVMREGSFTDAKPQWILYE